MIVILCLSDIRGAITLEKNMRNHGERHLTSGMYTEEAHSGSEANFSLEDTVSCDAVSNYFQTIR